MNYDRGQGIKNKKAFQLNANRRLANKCVVNLGSPYKYVKEL